MNILVKFKFVVIGCCFFLLTACGGETTDDGSSSSSLSTSLPGSSISIISSSQNVESSIQASSSVKSSVSNSSSSSQSSSSLINVSSQSSSSQIVVVQSSSRSSSRSSSSISSSKSSSNSSSISSSSSSRSSSHSSSSKSSSSSLSSSRSSSSTASSSSTQNSSAFIAITTQYEFEGINPTNALYRDSNRFRIYYGGNGMTGPANTLGMQTDRNLNMTLDYLEAAYDMFVGEWGYRSPGLSVHSDAGPYYKMNIYSTTDLDAGGVMLYDSRAGLSYLEVNNSNLANADVVVHEFGHSLTLTEYHWVNQGRTGAWWETVAQWVADTFKSSSYYAAVGAKYSVSQSGTIIDLNTTLGRSYLTLVHADNRYQAWPFLTYLTKNPDNFSGLGRDAVVNLMRNHQNNETPLHTLNRMVSPLNAQTVVGYYWAHMAYLDIGHPIAQQRLFNVMNGSSFRSQAYANLESIGNQTYKVKTARQPMYAGANIIPLTITGGGNVDIQITNLGNGFNDSNFTAIVAIRSGSNFRYQLLESGNGTINIASSEEASLVVANTPNNLIQYDAFASKAGDADLAGLNYQVKLIGAVPRD